MKIDHIGMAVKDLEASKALYKNLFDVEPFHYEEILDQKVCVYFIQIGEQKLELIQGTDEQSPICKFIEKRGEGMHHIAYKVEDIYSSLDDLKQKGFRLIDHKPRIGALNKLIAFIHPKDTQGVLIELVQPISSDPELD